MGDDAPSTFLGLSEDDLASFDIAILPIPFEMTTSWGEGTEHGPAACIAASSQVELFDPLLPSELPCGLSYHTATAWSSEAPSLLEQLSSIKSYLEPWMNGEVFPLILGGEHGILPPIIESLSAHPKLSGDVA